MENWLETLELEGERVKLVPLLRSHKEGLLEAAADGKLWELWFTSVPSQDSIDAYIEQALKEKNEKSSLPFVVIDKKHHCIVGATRYCHVAAEHKRLEIGYTWYAKSAQGTGVNTECKYLMLSYAFEKLDCICVQFKTDWFNIPSRNAISRLGAKQDGVLRNDRLNKDGTYRDTVVFSIIQQEWHGVKKSLEYKLRAHELC
ncbi:GNAT family protein [Echinicola sediminis]